MVTDVVVGPSPAWVRYRLESLGIRAISNVVDVTNLILLEFGHPMHAFDLEKLRGQRIVVRRATSAKEKLADARRYRHASLDLRRPGDRRRRRRGRARGGHGRLGERDRQRHEARAPRMRLLLAARHTAGFEAAWPPHRVEPSLRARRRSRRHPRRGRSRGLAAHAIGRRCCSERVDPRRRSSLPTSACDRAFARDASFTALVVRRRSCSLATATRHRLPRLGFKAPSRWGRRRRRPRASRSAQRPRIVPMHPGRGGPRSRQVLRVAGLDARPDGAARRSNRRCRATPRR